MTSLKLTAAGSSYILNKQIWEWYWSSHLTLGRKAYFPKCQTIPPIVVLHPVCMADQRPNVLTKKQRFIGGYCQLQLFVGSGCNIKRVCSKPGRINKNKHSKKEAVKSITVNEATYCLMQRVLLSELITGYRTQTWKWKQYHVAMLSLVCREVWSGRFYVIKGGG